MRPFQESAPDRYCRLFPPARQLENAERYGETLRALGTAMVDNGRRVSEQRPEILAETGYTYFGQLVAHDLTKDISSIEESSRKEPSELENLHTPRLDLQVLYGGGPERSPELYEDDGVRLKHGKVFDVCLDRKGEAVLADDRSAGNLILRQMTAIFCRMHNLAVEQLRSRFSDAALLFRNAQQRTRWQFQYLVVRDYLAAILDRDVYRKIFLENQSQMEWKRFSIPVEFSAAAMRFGHAMVRPNYLFSLGHEMRLPEIFGRRADRGPIRQELKINWGFFFQGAGPASAVTARPIDTRLAQPFQQLPADLIGAPAAACPLSGITQAPTQLALRTLLRGAALRLPSGQTVARAFGELILTEAELTHDASGRETEQGRIIHDAEWSRETPLWYYILKESEVRQNGNRLGPTGSHLVAETIFAALRSDPDAYFNKSKGEEFPPVWKFFGKERHIHGLSELFRLASCA